MEHVLDRFHSAVASWFRSVHAEPTDCQEKAWPAIQQGCDTLIAAPTGSGKTLAAFLAVIDELAREGDLFGLPDETRVLYVSPLKALSNDIHKNLEAPLEGINKNIFEAGAPPVAIRAQVRTGDTPAVTRAAMVRHPPHILVTTPESLYILLTSDSGRRMLTSVRTVIIDEIHAVVTTKRGAHLALSLERLSHLVGRRLIRIGLSATQKPIGEVARFLTGGAGDCVVIDHGHRRQLDLAIELPRMPLEAVLSHLAAAEIYDRMADLIQAHRTTLIFVNTRRLAERVAYVLTARLGEHQVTSHHGSLSREQRLSAEDRLKRGQLRALVATASLELGIDVGEIDLVCQLGSTASISTFVQRVGRSGHTASGFPKGRLFPTSRDDLVECIALIQAVRRGDLDHLAVCIKPLDVLAQQVVAMVAAEDWTEDELYRCIIQAYPFRDLRRPEFDQIVRMLAEGYSTQRGVRGAYLHRDGIHKRLRARRGTRLAAITCGGAIPDNAEYRVVLEPGGELLGAVDEHFAIESVIGDVFQLGNCSWRVLGLEGAALRVADANGQPPSIPFWFGEAPGRSFELSESLSRLRTDLGRELERSGLEAARDMLRQISGIPPAAVEQVVHYVAAAKAALGFLPTMDSVVFERFFDESGGMQFIIHAPFGSRINRAWGLALRKRFCRTFNFELQAAANENALILSLGTSQSFPLQDVQRFLRSETVRDLLIQALLDAPMFIVRWRWNAVCSLAVKRFQNGQKTRPHLLRMQAEDLVTSVFPDQLACLENIVGDRNIPDHPLVQQTIRDCLTEAMDIHRFIDILRGIESGAIRVVCRDVMEPSPFAAEIVNARVHSFLDGAPLEERRTRAVTMRRRFDPQGVDTVGAIDGSAVEKVCREAWPEANSTEELHDALQIAGFLVEPAEIDAHWPAFFRELARQQRATRLVLTPETALWVAAERWPQVRAIHAAMPSEPPLRLPPDYEDQQWSREEALVMLLRARLAIIGPVSETDLARCLMIATTEIRCALARLENEGLVLRGHYTESAREIEWCERRLAARMSRYGLDRRRREIKPATVAEFSAFLLRWHRLDPESKMRGKQALSGVLEQLEGFDVPAAAWEASILPSRFDRYDPSDLDQLCQSGQFTWMRLRRGNGTQAPLRSTPIALLPRRSAAFWRPLKDQPLTEATSGASAVAALLGRRGALFYDEIIDSVGLLPTAVERALAELVTLGRVTSDSFSGLRALLVPEQRKQRYKGLGWGLEHAGRWTLIARQDIAESSEVAETATEHAARVLLRRYGVMFRSLLMREGNAPPWRDLVRIYRRLEARGEITGGRFVSGPFGEQFALPEALESMHASRRNPLATDIAISAPDPLNLVGIISPGVRVPATSGRRILLRLGVPVGIIDTDGAIQWLGEAKPSESTGEFLSVSRWASRVREYRRGQR